MQGRKKTEPSDQAIGRSKGGLSTKIHATTDALGNPIGCHLTPGQASDLDGADELLPQLQADTLLGDRGYDADERVIAKLTAQGKTAVIPPRRNRKELRTYNAHLYASRHLIENFFASLSYRAITTRYDKLAVCLGRFYQRGTRRARLRNFLGAIYLAATAIWLS